MADNKQDKDLDISEVYTKSELFIEKNKKPLTIAAVALFVGVAAFVGWRQFVVGPAIKDAEENVWKAQYYFEIDSLDLAINGDGQWLGFEAIADEYGNTPTGDLAHSYLGAIYMKQEQWQMAIDHYEEADLGDDVLRVMAVGNIGDCYVEMNEMDKAVGQFEKAADMVKSDFTSPMYLMKAGILHKQAGNWKAAAKGIPASGQRFPAALGCESGQEVRCYGRGHGGLTEPCHAATLADPLWQPQPPTSVTTIQPPFPMPAPCALVS
ncbi:MAG: tetratricopeptide repeat protein [Flavobacteriales bacterium]|nr:tetratricopeptide repeat protein [Flavobacteriales bacterium]